MVFILFLALKLLSYIDNHTPEVTMYNALDKCTPWPAKKTALFISNLKINTDEFEFIELDKILILRNSKTTKLYAVFFKTSELCTNAVQIKRL